MKRYINEVLTLRASYKTQRFILLILVAFVYFLNFSENDIWTPNESFYAEAVREMFESGNFLDIQYNYEPRYNKPPLTYWLMASSAAIFGINEFALRFPIILTGLGSIWLCYLLGRKVFGESGGIYMLVLSAFSVQFLAVKQYASPEMPLTFFFTLTLYWFYIGYHERKSVFLLLSYVALGLTVLTKGFPYIIVIGGIIGVYTIVNNQFQLKQIWNDLKRLQLPIGLLITTSIGLSWVLYMYLKYGQDFWEVYNRETFGRAFTRKSSGMKLDFYPGVIMWSIAPYSFAFLFAFIYWIRKRLKDRRILFPMIWFLVMLVIFSMAKGKLPTYMIQAHPALLLLIVPLIQNYHPKDKVSRLLWATCFWSITLITIGVHAVAIHYLKLDKAQYVLPLLTIVILFIVFRLKGVEKNLKLLVAPFWSILFLLITFATFMPRLEHYRPYDTIGRIINEELVIDKSTPIHIEKTLIHNIPFYAKRKVLRDATPNSVNAHSGATLALIRTESAGLYDSDFEIVWSGMIYDFASESQFGKFVAACLQAENGDLSKFAAYQLIYKAN